MNVLENHSSGRDDVSHNTDKPSGKTQPIQQKPAVPALQKNMEPAIQQKKLPGEKEISPQPFMPAQKKENAPLQLKKRNDHSIGVFKPVQRTENKTGLPDNLKTGVENLSSTNLSDVKVHYNSSQPAEYNALAYAQGSDIHVAPGQEQHLPHEAENRSYNIALCHYLLNDHTTALKLSKEIHKNAPGHMQNKVLLDYLENTTTYD